MSRKRADSKPDAEHRRKAVAARRLGKDSKCTRCGEDRPHALIRNSDPRICAACQRQDDGESVIDGHHAAGQNNHCATVPIPVNDHRARMSVAQYSWPVRTLRNPDRSPLLAVAAYVRSLQDFADYIDDVLPPEKLESLDADLVRKFGSDWPRDPNLFNDSKTHQENSDENE